VIAEGTFGAYDLHVWHITHSACKSITGLAIGMLIDEGKLDLEDSVPKVLEKIAPKLSLLTHKNLQVRHLLTMTSGIVFNEAGAVTETDWVKSYLESTMIPEPGEYFAYNSMNTYMLSVIIRQASGQGLMEYLQERLWGPLGITGVFWETCPKGIEKGGWGLYIRPEDLAKIGQLVLQKGCWKGKQLVSESWINQATAFQMKTSSHLGGYNYGYHIWVGRNQNSFLFNGMFGQNVVGFPDSGLLIVINAGNDELFQQSSFFTLVGQYFPQDYYPSKAISDNTAAYRRLQKLQGALRKPLPSKTDRRKACLMPDGQWAGRDKLCNLLSSKVYIMEESESRTIGLLPFMAQAIQNNYTKGLTSITFTQDREDFILTIRETDEEYRMPVGFDTPRISDLSFHGEPYRVGVKGCFCTDEDDHLVLKLRVSFLEIANTRLLKIFFTGDKIITKWSEYPGRPYLINAMTGIMSDMKLYPFLESVMAKTDKDLIRYKLNQIMEPEVTGRYVRKEAGRSLMQ
jgi:CubicO group peptidase (beta-lactamase class C family)